MADNVVDLLGQVAAREKEKKPSIPKPVRPPDAPVRPVVRLHAGYEPVALDEVERLLIKGHADLAPLERIYQFGDRLVRVLWDKIMVAESGEEYIYRLHELTWSAMKEHMSRCVGFESWSKTEEDWIEVPAPKLFAETYLARGSWNVPKVLGVVTAPLPRADGSLMATPGYDAKTGIIYDPLGVKFPTIPDRPTRADALKSLSMLKRLLREYRFVTPADHSVALSAILTAVCRRALPVAPMHAFSSPVAGSGKSKLVDVASIIATGARAAVTATGKDRFGSAELEKRLIASMLAGDPVVTIDNIDGELDGEFLNQCLTQSMLKPRVLGFSRNVVVPNTTAFYATGNQLTLVGDLTRRVLVAQVDPGVERPELEEHQFDPVYFARRARPLFLAAALTIIRAFRVSGDRPTETWLGSYERWSRMVRSALTWLGETDPIEVMERTRAGDPRLLRLREMVVAWRNHLGLTSQRAADLTAAATARPFTGGYSENDEYINPQLREVVLAIASERSKPGISQEKLAWWLRKNSDRVVTIVDSAETVNQYRITRDLEASAAHGAVFKLEQMSGIVGFDDPPQLQAPLLPDEDRIPF